MNFCFFFLSFIKDAESGGGYQVVSLKTNKQYGDKGMEQCNYRTIEKTKKIPKFVSNKALNIENATNPDKDIIYNSSLAIYLL